MGGLATGPRGSKELNVFPRSNMEGAGQCTWRTGKHLRPSLSTPRTSWTTWRKIMGPTRLSVSRRRPCSRVLCLEDWRGPSEWPKLDQRHSRCSQESIPRGHKGRHRRRRGVELAGLQRCLQRGGTGAGRGATRNGVAQPSAVSRGAHPATTSSRVGQQNSESGRAKGSSRLPPGLGAGGPPPSGEPDPTGDPDLAALP